MKIFFTSDTHFYHKNILKFAAKSRQNIKDVKEMNEKLIRNWNSQVGPDDTVYILGDVSFAKSQLTEKILKRLNGRLNLIKGNHDTWLNHATAKYFEDIRDYRRISIDNIDVVMFHYPIAEWDKVHRGSFHLYGHVHGNLTLPGRAMDVGIDARPKNDMMLWEWDEIKSILSKKDILPHHDKN